MDSIACRVYSLYVILCVYRVFVNEPRVRARNTDVLCIVHCDRILLLMSVMGQGGLIIIELSSDQ
jgi:hypothetical protein